MIPSRSLRTVLLAVGVVLALALPLSVAPAQAATTAGSCKGFVNRPGMTNKVIRLGNASDLSGPVPGIYQSAQSAARAYVAYFNSARTICGRKLALDGFDSRTDAAADKAAYARICAKDFAAIGSMSTFDGGGAATAQACRLPDVRSSSLSVARNSCTTCFGAEANNPNEAANAVPDYFVASHQAASQKAAMLYINAGAYPTRALTAMKVGQKRGMHFVYQSGIDIADFNYGPYVQRMMSAGVQLVEFVGGYQQAARLSGQMEMSGFKPAVRLFDSSVYNPSFASLGGTSVQGSLTAIDFYPLNASQSELNLYKKWLAKVAPTEDPTPAGLFAWSAAKLTIERMTALGGKLSRNTLNTSLRTIHTWTAGGLHSPMDVGGKHTASCVRFLSLKGSAWVSVGGTAYRCAGVTKAS